MRHGPIHRLGACRHNGLLKRRHLSIRPLEFAIVSFETERDVLSASEFVVKDSGAREQFDSGMVRDTATGKMRPDLVRDGPMFMRWVMLLTKGAVKYAARNWMKAKGQDEFDRFLESTDRHYTIWYMWRRYGINIENPDNWTREPLSEDHAAATIFNMNGVEYTADEMAANVPAVKPMAKLTLDDVTNCYWECAGEIGTLAATDLGERITGERLLVNMATEHYPLLLTAYRHAMIAHKRKAA